MHLQKASTPVPDLPTPGAGAGASTHTSPKQKACQPHAGQKSSANESCQGVQPVRGFSLQMALPSVAESNVFCVFIERAKSRTCYVSINSQCSSKSPRLKWFWRRYYGVERRRPLVVPTANSD